MDTISRLQKKEGSLFKKDKKESWLQKSKVVKFKKSEIHV